MCINLVEIPNPYTHAYIHFSCHAFSSKTVNPSRSASTLHEFVCIVLLLKAGLGANSKLEACPTLHCSMAAKQIAEMVAFLEALGKSETEGQDEQKQAETQARLLQACLADVRASRCFSVSAATEIMTQLAGNPRLPQWIKSQILEVVQEKVEVAAAEQPAETKEKDKRPTQKHHFLFNYLTAEDLSMDAKERLLAKRMAFLGLVCPKEPCFKQATALLLLAGHTGSLETFQFNARAAYNLLLDFKEIFRTLVKSPVYTHSGLLAYAEAPADLPCNLFKKAYQDKKPEPPLLEVDAVLALAEAAPARKSHGSVVSRPFDRAASKRVGDSSVQDRALQPSTLLQPCFGELRSPFCPPKKEEARVRATSLARASL